MTWPVDKEAPKFWDTKEQKVVEGIEIRKTPTKLADILGTYVWVYSGDPQFGGDVEEMFRSGYKDEEEFIARNGLKIGADTSQPVTTKSINGHVNWGTCTVVFDGVRRVREGWSSNAAVPWMESNWEMQLTENYDEEDRNVPWLDMEGNMVGVAVVLDDNGCPFLVFDWSHPPGCHSSWSGYYVGKRLVEGKDWRFTNAERGRLGIGRSEAHFSKEGNSKKVNEGDEDEESNEENENEDEDNEEESEEDEEDVVSSGGVDVGEKRKASSGETGANKRRRT